LEDLVVERQNLHDYVADQIRKKILDRNYESGTQLPNEYQLAQEYNVCRYTVREAIKKLTATGLIEVQRGKGTFVSGYLPSSYLKHLLDIMILDDQEVQEIFVARLAIEEKTAGLAAKNATPEGISRLEEEIMIMEKSLVSKRLQTYNDSDLMFHLNIAKIAGNKLLYEILVVLHDMIRHAINTSAIKTGDRWESIKGHKEILRCIKRGNADMAIKNMVNHLNTCLKVFEKPKPSANTNNIQHIT
jgi:GntR family transcriptional repressor for pyruvate dehydrogenase complex